MNTRLLARVRPYYYHDMVPRELARRNMREWIRAARLVSRTQRGWVSTPKVTP